MELSSKEITRYSRQLLLPEIGKEGQSRLKQAKVLIVGAGGLGSPVAIYLATAGVGTVGIIDPDQVELTNLHRQIIHSTPDIGKPKVVSAKEKIFQLNPEIKVVTYPGRFTAQNALKIIQNYDLIVDGTDNFPTRYLINDACVLSGKPFIFGGVFRFEGQCSVFAFENGPCYRCLFENPPQPGQVPSCTEAGVLGVLPGIIGLLQANEAIKIICQIGETLKERLLIFDGLTTQFREIQIKKNPDCLICGPKRTIHQVTECAPICSPDVQDQILIPTITVQELKTIIEQKPSHFCLIDVREQKEWDIDHIASAILKPLSTLENNYHGIPKDRKIYVHCKTGGRSLAAIKFLRTKGYRDLFLVSGGMDAWTKIKEPN